MLISHLRKLRLCFQDVQKQRHLALQRLCTQDSLLLVLLLLLLLLLAAAAWLG